MQVQKLAAFADGSQGGNPAGVVIAERLPAAEVGFSETAFAAPQGGGWRVRYFAPLAVPCSGATVRYSRRSNHAAMMGASDA